MVLLFLWYMVVPFTGYPNKDAAHVALETVRKWLEINADKVSITVCTEIQRSSFVQDIVFSLVPCRACFLVLLPSVF